LYAFSLAMGSTWNAIFMDAEDSRVVVRLTAFARKDHRTRAPGMNKPKIDYNEKSPLALIQ